MERWIGQMTEKGWNIREYQASVVPRDADRQTDVPELPGRTWRLLQWKPRQGMKITDLSQSGQGERSLTPYRKHLAG
jgi:hypothetical protein